MEFQEKYNVQVGMFSTGSTVAVVTPYYSMRDYRRADFYVAGLVKLDSTGALGGTDYQQFTIAAYQASDSTGGGETALASATAITGKDAATGVSTSMKLREGLIFFATFTSAVTYEITVGTAAYTGATATAAANQFSCASAAAATVAVQAFVTMFNSTADNTSTAITANWKAATMAAGIPWARILPKDPDGTHSLILGTTGSSNIGVGGVFQAHIGIDRQFMSDGKTHLAVKVNSTESANPFTVTVIREADFPPVKSVMVSKSINQSTSK